MVYILLKGDKHINTIIADEPFVQAYCEANGYTYELQADQELQPTPEIVPTTEERVAELEEALNMILTGYAGEEGTSETGTA